MYLDHGKPPQANPGLFVLVTEDVCVRSIFRNRGVFYPLAGNLGYAAYNQRDNRVIERLPCAIP